jgi:hypothetical protein
LSGYIPQELFNGYAILIAMCHLDDELTMDQDDLAAMFHRYQKYYNKDKKLFDDLELASDRVLKSIRSNYPNPAIHKYILRQIFFLSVEYQLNGTVRDIKLFSGKFQRELSEYSKGRVNLAERDVQVYIKGTQERLFPVVNIMDCPRCGNANSDSLEVCFICSEALLEQTTNDSTPTTGRTWIAVIASIAIAPVAYGVCGIVAFLWKYLITFIISDHWFPYWEIATFVLFPELMRGAATGLACTFAAKKIAKSNNIQTVRYSTLIFWSAFLILLMVSSYLMDGNNIGIYGLILIVIGLGIGLWADKTV